MKKPTTEAQTPGTITGLGAKGDEHCPRLRRNKTSLLYRQAEYPEQFIGPWAMIERQSAKQSVLAAPVAYTLEKPREAPVIGPYKQRIIELLPKKKVKKKKRAKGRQEVHKIYEILKLSGYTGSEGAVHNFACREKRKDEYKEKSTCWNSIRARRPGRLGRGRCHALRKML